MKPTKCEQRLREIQYKICELGRVDTFNISLRRDALAKLEVVFTERVAEERASLLSSHPIVRSLCTSGRR